jgi:hypothetical protein
MGRNAQRRRQRKQKAAPPWTRLDHEGLGMPAPAVYLPQRILPPDTRGMWGFEPISTRPGSKGLPYARRGDLVLAAHIGGPDEMDLLIAPASGPPVAVDDLELLASGRFTDLHPAEWKQAAYSAGSLVAVIGPDDFPGMDLSQVQGLDRNDPEQVREGTRRLVRGLWIFKAAIAVVPLGAC